MAESTLTLTYFDFLGEVGSFLGYGRGDDGDNADPAWTASQEAAVTKSVAAGQRQFYFPPPLEGERHAHEWSFLKPVGSVTLADGDSSAQCPEDFGGFDGPITITVSGSTTNRTLTLVGEGVVRRAQAENPDTTGMPQMVALRPLKGLGLSKGQRFELVVWPEADDSYVLQFAYTILPDAISGAKPYSYGGTQHVETVLASCLERAEFYRDNARGVCWLNWQERLAASVSIDRRMRPVVVGRNADRPGSWEWAGSDYWQTVTYDGVIPENA